MKSFDIARGMTTTLRNGALCAALALTSCGGPRLHFAPPPPVGCSPPPSVVLPLERIGQQTDMWCWAAAGEMISRNLGHPVTQCEMAKKQFNAECACPTCTVSNPSGMRATLPPCDQGAFPNLEDFDFDVYGVRQPDTGLLSLAQIKDEIACRHAPIAFSRLKSDTKNTADPDGHMMLIVGYETDDSLIIMDPAPVCPSVADSVTEDYGYYLNGNLPGWEHWEDRYAVKWVGR